MLAFGAIAETVITGVPGVIGIEIFIAVDALALATFDVAVASGAAVSIPLSSLALATGDVEAQAHPRRRRQAMLTA